MTAALEIQLIAILAASACALPGVFLVLRKMSMMSDSITHTILLGIILAFFITHDLSSPLLFLGASLMGLVTVWCTEYLSRSRLVSGDAAIGLVFPLLFSIAIILLTRYAGRVHICTDSVLLGELAFAPFNRLIIGGIDFGAKGLYTSGLMLLVNLVFITVFYKELKLATFDSTLAMVMGFSPSIIHYSLMTLVSVTTVGAFEALGSVLVIAFMVGPAATAYLLTDSLHHMLALSVLFGALSGVLGFQLAMFWDVSIAGSMAVMVGLMFAIVFIAAPKRGLLSIAKMKRQRVKNFADSTLLMHIHHHENTASEREELGLKSICKHLNWDKAKMNKSLKRLSRQNALHIEKNIVKLSPEGQSLVVQLEKEWFGGEA